MPSNNTTRASKSLKATTTICGRRGVLEGICAALWMKNLMGRTQDQIGKKEFSEFKEELDKKMKEAVVQLKKTKLVHFEVET